MILVTGASGFVGRALCRTLEARALPHRAVARRAAPSVLGLGSLDPRTDWREALRGVGTVVHLAARVHVMRDTALDPLQAFRETNVGATLNLARQAQEAGVSRFVFVSSIKVNGERTEPGRPFKEMDAPMPADAYGRSKHEAEDALRDLGRHTGLEVVIIRPPLVYGAGVRANFRTMVDLVARGVPLPLASIRNKRSLVSVGNLVDLILLCADHPRAAGQTFLAGDGEDLSTPDILRGVARSLGRPSRLFPMPPACLAGAARLVGKEDVAHRLLDWLQVDIGFARSRLDWTPPQGVAQAFDDAARQGW